MFNILLPTKFSEEKDVNKRLTLEEFNTGGVSSIGEVAEDCFDTYSKYYDEVAILAACVDGLVGRMSEIGLLNFPEIDDAIYRSFILYGNAFFEMNGDRINMISPKSISVWEDSSRRRMGYRRTIDGQREIFYNISGDVVEGRPEDMKWKLVHIKAKTETTGSAFGKSLLTPLRFSLETLLASARNDLNLLRKGGGITSLVAINDPDLSEEERMRVAFETKKQMESDDKHVILPTSAQVMPLIKQNKSENEMEKAINRARSDVMLLFGLPVKMHTAENNTQSNIMDIKEQILTLSTMPCLKLFLKKLNQCIPVKMRGRKVEIDGSTLDYSRLHYVGEAIQKFMDSSVFTINEGRELATNMLGINYESIKGADEIIGHAGKTAFDTSSGQFMSGNHNNNNNGGGSAK